MARVRILTQSIRLHSLKLFRRNPSYFVKIQLKYSLIIFGTKNFINSICKNNLVKVQHLDHLSRPNNLVNQVPFSLIKIYSLRKLMTDSFCYISRLFRHSSEVKQKRKSCFEGNLHICSASRREATQQNSSYFFSKKHCSSVVKELKIS